MTFFSKTKIVFAALLAATSIVGQNNSCGAPKKPTEPPMMRAPLMPAYNAPARIDVRGSWDFFAEGSFTYWQALQDNMDLGVVIDSTSTLGLIKVVNNNANYHPGFRVGIGMDFERDDWDTFVEYTWFRGSQSNATHLDPTSTTVALEINWPNLNSIGSFFDGSEHWRLHMDLLDWELARSYFVGSQLTFRPFFAARAAWIRQAVAISGSDPTIPTVATLNSKSASWGIGPRAGLYSEWLLGEGLRFFGNAMADILFTQYTTLSSFYTLNGTSVSKRTQHNLNCLRPHVEGELGLGWGTYFDNNNWHVDFSAGYGFQVFFDQNMFRKDAPDLLTTFSPNGNLYVHGLNLNARFDF